MEHGETVRPRGGPLVIEIPLQRLLRIGKCLSGVAVVIVGAHMVAGADRVPSTEIRQLVSEWLMQGAYPLQSKSQAEMLLEAEDGLAGRFLATAANDGQSSSAVDPNSCGGHSGLDKTLESTFAFLMFCFLACTIIDHCNLYVPIAWRFPISVMMFIAGILVGIVFLHIINSDHLGNGFDNFLIGVEAAAWVDPHALLLIVLPPLLYESASSMNWHAIKKVLPSCLCLALPGVVLNTFLTGGFVRYWFRMDEENREAPTFAASLLLGSILSATDPVAVVSALAALGAPKKLSSLVEGESLLNDGTSVVCAYVFRDWVLADRAPPEKRFCTNSPPYASCVTRFFFTVAVGGAAIGVAIGLILFWWIRTARALHYPVLEMSIILMAVYGSFFLAESMHTSGVLAVVTIGFMMSAGVTARLSHHGRHNHHVIFSQIGYACNQVAFFAAGIVSARFFEGKNCVHSAMTIQAWMELGVLYFTIHATRTIVVVCFWPLLRNIGYGITWKEAVILVWGGLRGAVGLILGLIIEHNPYMDPKVSQMIAFHTSGIVLLTLAINGSTIDGLYKRLKLYPENSFRMKHLRTVLYKLEAECQHAGIRQMSSHWMFKDCIFNKCIRCVPSFKHIKFDVAGLAVPDDIESVQNTLLGLGPEADQHRTMILQKSAKKLHKGFSGSFNGDFAKQWKKRKEMESEQKFTELITSARHDLSDVKDAMIKITNTGDRQLDYRPPETKAQTGFYISCRPLSLLREGLEEDELDHFTLRIVKADKIQIIVGLVADIEDITMMNATKQDSQVLGAVAPNSVAFNCFNGVLQFQGLEGHEVPQIPKPPPLDPGDVLRVVYFRPHHSDWEVRFEILKHGSIAYWCAGSFGPFDPDEVHPAVEFRCVDESAHFNSRRFSSDNSSMFTDDLSNRIPGSIAQGIGDGMDAVVSSTNKAARQVATAATSAAGGITSAAGGIVEKVRKLTEGKTPEEGVSLIGESSMGGAKSAPANLPASGKSPASAKVDLSFEPQLASSSESINELFQVLFNTVMTKYTDMHEHGVLGDLALTWLTEAVSVAMDSANNEVGAFHAKNFRNCPSPGSSLHNSNSQLVADSGPSPPKSENGDIEGSPSKSGISSKSSASSGKPKRSISAHSEALQRMRTAFGKLRGGPNSKDKLVGLFEPLVVEYFCLESTTSSTSVFDRLPASWERLRLMGYNQTRAKVESLWAFVEAHEHFISDSRANVARFPDLVICISTIVSEAKNDLMLLQEIQPRRFFYSKHLLMLRVLLNNRHQKLQKYVKDGWIAEGDGKGLNDAVWERIVQVDQYVPRVGVCFFSRSEKRILENSVSTDTPQQGRIAPPNAWDDVDFKAFQLADMAAPTADTKAYTMNRDGNRKATDIRRQKTNTWVSGGDVVRKVQTVLTARTQSKERAEEEADQCAVKEPESGERKALLSALEADPAKTLILQDDTAPKAPPAAEACKEAPPASGAKKQAGPTDRSFDCVVAMEPLPNCVAEQEADLQLKDAELMGPEVEFSQEEWV